MIETFIKLEECINNCLLRRLLKPYHEKDYHPEYQLRSNKLEQYFPKLIDVLESLDFSAQLEIASSSLYCVLILYLELKTQGPWNTESINAKEYPMRLNQTFKTKNSITLEDLLLKDNFLPSQEVFDKCIRELHQKVTFNDFKQYPALIEVYRVLIENVKDYNVIINPVTVLPVALFMVDDYITPNKITGLQSCGLIFECLQSYNFNTGNYYEVVYRSLMKNIVEKDTEVTKCLFKCLPDFIKILPPGVKKSKLDDIFSKLIDQMHTESNLYRKAQCLNFTTTIIEMHGVHCVKKKMFVDIICDNLDICSKEGVYEILVEHVLQCLQMWIRHCWCTWKLSNYHMILSSLMKVLYLAKGQTIVIQIQNIILTLIYLCTIKEQKQIYSSLETFDKCPNLEFITRINAIKEKMFA